MLTKNKPTPQTPKTFQLYVNLIFSRPISLLSLLSLIAHLEVKKKVVGFSLLGQTLSVVNAENWCQELSALRVRFLDGLS